MKPVFRTFIFPVVIFFTCVFILPVCAEAAFLDNPDAVEKVADSVFMLEVYDKNHSRIAIGSGFVAFEQNLIVTNYHVIDGASYIIANSDDNERFSVESVIAIDEKLDIALLRLDPDVSYIPLTFDTETVLKRSMRVVAIGSPAGLMNTISIGNISAFYHDASKDWIQFTAPISSGSSGGPLLNDQGKVIGMTTASYASAQNVNMAVRSSDIINLYYHSTTHPDFTQLASSVSQKDEQGANSEDKDIRIVYVTTNGRKYHLNPSCSRMKNPQQINILDAIRQGYEPCGICYR